MGTNFLLPRDCENAQAPTPTLEELHAEQERRAREASDMCNQAFRQKTDAEVLAELFRYRQPNESTIPKYAAINQAAKNFAEVILQNCPAGSDRRGVINWIRMARMTANAAVALN